VAATALRELVERFLRTYLEFRPVDATFMGVDGHDHRLPSADPDAPERERSALRDLERDALALPMSQETASQLELRMLRAQIGVNLRELEMRPRFQNPAWYTGEAAFGVISLLLPSDPPRRADDLRERLEGIPAFLRDGARWLAGAAMPTDWVRRARLEADALVTLLRSGLPKHAFWSASLERPAQAAARAVQDFAHTLDAPDADPACGEAHLAFLMREAHGLPYSPREAEELALEGFEAARRALQAMAARLDPTRDWRTQLEALQHLHPASVSDIVPTYEHWQERALEAADAHGLVTPAREYGLRFETLPAWAHEVAGALYFLFYRSPPAGRPGVGSVYWVFPQGNADTGAYLRSQNTAAIKSTHVVHHGSIGHHTQNARARASTVRLGQLAGTDCASGIAILMGGTTIEGWACYTQELMLEVPGFYTPLEQLQQQHNELRNTAMCLADLRLHRGTWDLAQMRAFYRDEVGVPEARGWAETTRNSIYPATRLMYWLGTRAIRAARGRIRLESRAFHDALIGYGSLPVHWVIEELERARR
jgi:uncharacterized protein (DUF885 family)